MPRGAVEDLQGLIQQLQDEAWPRRLEALREATALLEGGTAPRDGLAPLEQALLAATRDPKWEVRRAAVVALAEAGSVTPVAVDEALKQLVQDPNPWVRRAAAQAAQRLQERPVEQKDERWVLSAMPQDPTLEYIVQRIQAIGPRTLTPQDIFELVQDVGERYYRDLAAETAHEVRTLLTPIEGYLAALADHMESLNPPDAKAERYTERLLARAAQLAHLVEDLRDYSSPAGQAATTVDLARVVADAVELARERTAMQGTQHAAIRTRLEVPDGLQVEAFADRLTRALVNVMTNAYQAMAKGGTMTVKATTAVLDPGQPIVRLEITDTGPGMSEADVYLALQRFKTTRGDQGGTGLGLPIAQRIIEKDHGGRLTLHSRLGEGTTVRVELPRRHPVRGR